ncbi:MAG: hypothetical protein PHC99_08030 [Methylococcales bacterium]|nr:hypothetical protein [Methylococcales bacterium]
MTKCLSCGHLRHDFELNCPKCGSFYSTIMDDLAMPEETKTKLLTKIKTHLEHPKHRGLAISIGIFMIILLGLFL